MNSKDIDGIVPSFSSERSGTGPFEKIDQEFPLADGGSVEVSPPVVAGVNLPSRPGAMGIIGGGGDEA